MAQLRQIFLALLVPLALALAWVGGQYRTTEAIVEQLSNMSPDIIAVTQMKDSLYTGKSSKDKEKTYFIATSTEPSYGGPMTVATVVDNERQIRFTAILSSSDTRSYLEKVTDLGILKSAVDTPIDQLSEVDIVSGATLSSIAIIRAVEDAAGQIGSAEFGMAYAEGNDSPATQETLKIILICLFFAAAYLISTKRVRHKKRARALLLGAATVVLGFWFGTQPSLATLATLLDGNWLEGMATYATLLCLALIIITYLLTRKNLFCTSICPFGAIQEGIGKITGCPAPLQSRWMVWVARGWVLLVLLAALYFQAPSYAMYGPLGMALSFIGSGIIYGLTILVVLSSLMFKQPWCKLFCPTTIMVSYLRFTRKAFSPSQVMTTIQPVEDIRK